MRHLIIALLLFLVPPLAHAAPLCAARSEAAPALAQLSDVMETGRFIAYQPTSLRVINGVLEQADPESIREDLQTLRPWFDGLITYGAEKGAETIPDIAAELGYRALIIGVWDPANKLELDNAIAAWERNKSLVVGISLGNELVFSRRDNWADLAKAIADLHKRAPELPVTTSEPFAQFLEAGAAPVLSEMDFMSVHIHPIFEPWFSSAPVFNWADFVVRVGADLQHVFCGPVLVKETGVPTGPRAMGYDEARQRAFYRALEKQLPATRKEAFAYFSAFDAPWRVNDVSPVPGHHPEEAHWGLFGEDRAPKRVMQDMPYLRLAR